MGAQLLEQIIRDLGLEDISFKIWRYLSEMSGKTLCLKQYCFLKIVKDKNVMFILSPTKGKKEEDCCWLRFKALPSWIFHKLLLMVDEPNMLTKLCIQMCAALCVSAVNIPRQCR